MFKPLFLVIFPPMFFFLLSALPLSEELHGLCLQKLNFESRFSDIYKALVCGKRLPFGGSIRDLFTQGGLIHLTVISGAHLFFLERFWKKLPLPFFIKTYGLFVVLILYAFAGNMQAPVARALFAFYLFQLSVSFKLFWDSSFINLLSGLLCLLYKASWANSFSLQLSLLACFLQNVSKHSLKKGFFIYLFLLPLINRWGALHPFSVFIHWAFAPLVGSFLFPLSFLSPFIPWLYGVSDFLWGLSLKLLRRLSFFPSKTPLMGFFIPKDWVWLYIGTVCFLIFFVRFFRNKSLLYRRTKGLNKK